MEVNKNKLIELITSIDCPNCPMFYEGCGCALEVGTYHTTHCIDLGLKFVIEQTNEAQE